MKRGSSIAALILLVISSVIAGPPSDSAAVEILTRVAHRVEGVDHSATLTIEKYSRGKLTATQRMKFHIRYPATDSITMQTVIELLPGSRGAGQKFWLWQLNDNRRKQWLYSPGSGKLRQIARRRAGKMALFNLDDLALTEADIVGMEHTLAPQNPANGYIEIRSTAAGKSRRKIAGKRVAESHLWIDPQQNLVYKSQSFSAKGNLIQTIEVKATAAAGGVVWATVLEITQSRKNEMTRITMDDLTVGKLTDDSLFLPGRP